MSISLSYITASASHLIDFPIMFIHFALPFIPEIILFQSRRACCHDSEGSARSAICNTPLNDTKVPASCLIGAHILFMHFACYITIYLDVQRSLGEDSTRSTIVNAGNTSRPIYIILVSYNFISDLFIFQSRRPGP